MRDIQALVRRTRQRERDGQADAILIVLADSATNRRLVGELRASLGPNYRDFGARGFMARYAPVNALAGSGVVLV